MLTKLLNPKTYVPPLNVQQAKKKVLEIVDEDGYLKEVSFSDIQNLPTTLSGYGITDAYISNGTIYLGNQSITPAPASSLGTAAYKDYTTSVIQGGADLPTSDAVFQAIGAAVSSALHYRGISSTVITDGGTETAVIGGQPLVVQSGDVVIYSGFEFLWENNVWNKLGDDTSFALKTVQITGDGIYITGGGDLTTSRSLGLSQAAIDALTLASTAVQPTALDAYLRKIDVSGDISIDPNNGVGGVTTTATNETLGYKTTDTVWDCSRKWYFECVCKPVMGSNLKFLTHKGIGTGGSLKESAFRINNNNIQMSVSSNGSSVYPINTPFLNLGLVSNTWYHFIVVYDGTYVYLYANGVLKYTSSAYTFVDVLIGTSGWYMNPVHSPKLGRAGYLADSDVVADVVAAHYNNNNPFGYDSSVEGANCILEYLPENMLTTSIKNTAPGGYSYTYPTPKTFNILTENPWAAELTGTGIPATVPSYKGQKYIDTTTGLVYNALGNTSVNDWIYLVTNDNLDWKYIRNTPTLPIASSSVLGGIKVGNNLTIDADGVLSATGGGGGSSDWSDITNKPTTISGYGITDAHITSGTITLGSNTITPLTSFTETDPIFSASAAAGISSSDITSWNGKYTKPVGGIPGTDLADTYLTSYTETDPTVPNWAKAANKPSYNFSEIGSTPTTLSGYGITDAKIQSGTITLGSNTITPLTSFTETDPTVPSWAKASSKPSYSLTEISGTTDLQLIEALTGGGLLKRNANNTWSLDTNSYLTSYTETDPVFSASAAAGISSSDISTWNAKQKAITVSTSEPTSSQGSEGDIWIVI